MSRRRAARGGHLGGPARGAAGAIPAELLDANDAAWVDAEADAGLDAFRVWRARQRRHADAVEAFARARNLMSPTWVNTLDHQKLRALAEAHGQHWPPRRITREVVTGSSPRRGNS